MKYCEDCKWYKASSLAPVRFWLSWPFLVRGGDKHASCINPRQRTPTASLDYTVVVRDTKPEQRAESCVVMQKDYSHIEQCGAEAKWFEPREA
jgi:hypothetical protein